MKPHRSPQAFPLLPALVLAGLAACSGGSKPVQPTISAAAQKSAAADNARRKLEQTMTAGVRGGTGRSNVDMRFSVEPSPVVGQPFKVTVAILPNEGAPALKIEVEPVDGLVLAPITAPTSFEKVEPGSAYTVPLEFTASAPGVVLITVLATEASPTGSDTVSYSFPVVVDIAALAPLPAPGSKAAAPAATAPGAKPAA